MSSYWTLSPSFGLSSNAMNISSLGYSSGYLVDNEAGVREVFYLSSNTKFTGSGKSNDPFYAYVD